MALGDLDNDKIPEIVACTSGCTGVMALEHDGSLKWKNTSVGWPSPSIADLDGDGQPEVVLCYRVLNGATGKVISEGKKTDGKTSCEFYDAYTVVADLNGDKLPEIITASLDDHSLRAHHHDGKPFWKKAVDVNQGQATATDPKKGVGGGPPVVADFDGDKLPEIAVASGFVYGVFEHDGSSKWFKKTQDLTSRQTGSSVFDFEADDRSEVLYNDELVLRIYDGRTGHTVVDPICNTSGTLMEYPIAADVDNDGHAEIVVQVEVRNQGAAKVGPGVAVTLFIKDPAKGLVVLKTTKTTTTIKAGFQETLTIKVARPSQYKNQIVELVVKVDDDGTGQGTVNECKEDNNTVTLSKVSCD